MNSWRALAASGELAARAAVNITDEQLGELDKIQTELEEAYAGDDDQRAVRLNHEFHKAINVAATLEIDAVIDPAQTRQWILQGLRSCRPRHAPRRRFVDAW